MSDELEIFAAGFALGVVTSIAIPLAAIYLASRFMSSALGKLPPGWRPATAQQPPGKNEH